MTSNLRMRQVQCMRHRVCTEDMRTYQLVLQASEDKATHNRQRLHAGKSQQKHVINNYERFTLSINRGNVNYNENHPSIYLSSSSKLEKNVKGE